VHPNYRQATQSIVRNQGVETATIPLSEDGRIDLRALEQHADAVALVVQQPNFFGLLEDVDELTDWASERGILLVALVNPLTLAVLKPPGEWGKAGADICCGDGQPFGIPMSSGGPSFGFLCCRSALVRQMPGRIIGRTLDLDGQAGFTLTLQAREQHIRRGKATSNICTNQGLLVTAATIHMSLMGNEGIRAAGLSSAARTRELVQALTAIDGVEEKFTGPYFHERVLSLPERADDVVNRLLDRGFLGGLALGPHYRGMERCLLVCATEKRTPDEIDRFALALQECLAA
jgi:glycine dehydrogenase subunit 1